MGESTLASDNGGSADKDRQLFRPSISFETVTFSNGDVLKFDEDEIVVFVGPNNARKSATLREMQNWVSQNASQTVIKAATLRRDGTIEQLKSYLEKYALKTGSAPNYQYQGVGYNIHQSHLQFFGNPDTRASVAGFFLTNISTETRISDANAAGAIALYRQPPTHPIHLLLMDDVLAKKISRLFKHAFGSELIVFRAGGGSFPLYVGERPKLENGEDELSRSFVDRLQKAAVPLEEQGDGMRSFATVLLRALLGSHHSIQFLDEPEAFLHPPQARLIGEYIARERQAKSQLFIATHSTDVLDGLIAGGPAKVRIVRIQRDGSINRVKELSKEKTSAIANDTLSRYSKVFDGLFYQHVVICESDADCLFYNSLLNLKSISGDRRADVLFIHTAGKHRMAQLAETLRDLDVSVSVIADIDLLHEENAFRKLFETLGGDWPKVEGNFRSIKSSVEQRRPPLNAEQVAGLVRDSLIGIGGVGDFPRSAEVNIKRIFKTLSPWDDLKRAGRAALSSGQTIKHFDELVSKCSGVGLWIVPVGELEGFCRSIDGGHGPGFVAKVLEQRSLESDPELNEARDFVGAIWERARMRS
jgi:hypothetical protein